MAPDAALQQEFKSLAHQLGTNRQARLIVTAGDLGPAAYGWWPGARVACPRHGRRRKARRHGRKSWPMKLVHLRRFDTVAGSLQLVAQIVWWFHPAVWWANRQASAVRARTLLRRRSAVLDRLPAGRLRTHVGGDRRMASSAKVGVGLARHGGLGRDRLAHWRRSRSPCPSVATSHAALVLAHGPRQRLPSYCQAGLQISAAAPDGQAADDTPQKITGRAFVPGATRRKGQGGIHARTALEKVSAQVEKTLASKFPGSSKPRSRR